MVTKIVKILLGAIYIIFGLNFFLGFLPMPEMSGAAGVFMGGLMAAPYFFPFMKIVEIIGGILLIVGMYGAFASVILFPITLNIFLFHLFLAPAGIAMAIVMLIANVYIMFVHKDSLMGILDK